MKTKYLVISMFALFISFGSLAQKDVSDKSAVAITDFKAEDSGIASYFSSAYGYAIFPAIGKVGIGGASGNGTVYKGGANVGDCKMTQITIGFQAGGQSYAEVIFFETQAAFDRFTGDKFEFAAQVSAVALKAGASADAKYNDGLLVFTMSKGGLMYEASLGGQKFKTKMH